MLGENTGIFYLFASVMGPDCYDSPAVIVDSSVIEPRLSEMCS